MVNDGMSFIRCDAAMEILSTYSVHTGLTLANGKGHPQPRLHLFPAMVRNSHSNNNHLSVFVPPEAVYPGLPADESGLIELLSGLNRDDTLLISARLNAIVSGFGTLSSAQRQQKACHLICNDVHKSKIDLFARKHDGLDHVAIFFRGQILEMMRQATLHCRNLPDDGDTFNDEQVRDRFFRAILIAGSLWDGRVYGQRLSLEGGIDAARMRALGAFRKVVEDSSLALDPCIALGRSWLLFSEYLPKQVPDFASRFQTATGLTLEQYLVCVSTLIPTTVADQASVALFSTAHIGTSTAFKSVFPVYLALQSLTPDDFAGAAPDLPRTGFRALRERPVLSTSAGISVVLDPVMYGETLAIGPLFRLIAKEPENANMLFGYFGLAFERYAVDALRLMYPSGSGVLAQRLMANTTGCDGNGFAFEIDAALNDVTELVVFEMKAAWLREDSLLDATGAAFAEQLRRKYGVISTEGGLGERPKGVAQLAKIIGAVARKEWIGENGEFSQAIKIYPVLVVHDDRLDAPGCGKFLDDEFRSLLGTVPRGVVVAPLTLMTIDDLENLETSLAEFGLRDVLRDYEQECPDRMRSLRSFITTSRYASKLKYSRRVIDASEELVRRMGAGLFPKGSIAAVGP